MRNHVTLTQPLPAELADELIKRLPYVSEGVVQACLNEALDTVEFELAPQFANRADSVAVSISTVAEKLQSGYRSGMSRTLMRRDVSPSSFADDPHPILEAAGELVCFSRGQYGFGPRLRTMIERIDRLIKAAVRHQPAPEYQFPSLIDADVLDRCRYVQNFPASLCMVSHLREDLSGIQDFARNVSSHGGELVFDHSQLSGVRALLSPSVCFHWYNWLRDSDVSEGRIITAWGKCFRYESTNLRGLERLWDFSMREIIFVGSGTYVLHQRQRCIGMASAIMQELGLSYEISTATDPFFIDSYAILAAFQQGFELKYEVLCPLPYNRKKLAVGSINYHQDFFGRSFGISSGGAAAHTGCIGFGLERLALAVLAQYGTEENGWPPALRAAAQVSAVAGAD